MRSGRGSFSPCETSAGCSVRPGRSTGSTSTSVPAKCTRLLGENGAGKSTVARVAAGVLEPTSGDAAPRRSGDRAALGARRRERGHPADPAGAAAVRPAQCRGEPVRRPAATALSVGCGQWAADARRGAANARPARTRHRRTRAGRAAVIGDAPARRHRSGAGPRGAGTDHGRADRSARRLGGRAPARRRS